MAYDLTNLVNLKSYLGITVATHDVMLTEIIAGATSAIEAYCGRHLVNRAWPNRRFDGSGTGFLLLDEYPVSDIQRVAIGWENAITVTNTSTDATRATVAVRDVDIVLTIVGGAGAGTNTLTFAANATLTALAAAINALGTGWSAALSDSTIGHYVSTELLKRPAVACLDTTGYLAIPGAPGCDDYECDWERGILRRIDASWPAGSLNIIVDYTAGYSTVPDDLEFACKDVAAAMWRRRELDLNLKSESLGDYSYTLADIISDIPASALATFNRYRDRRGF